jgi:DNA replication and repair protein RecF
MYLQKLKLTNFKNYKEADIEFSDKINCLVGDNGAGKTNILDAVYYLSFCKSYFNPVDVQNINHESDFFAIHGNYLRNNTSADKVSCIQKKGTRKQFRINNNEYERLADHIGLFPLVMISPYDRDLINEGSDVRRKYIDGVISQFDHVYLDNLLNYNKVLTQRNILLKKFADGNSFDNASILLWNEQLVKYGENIFEKRKYFLENFIPIFQYYFNFISGGNEKVGIIYESQLKDGSLREMLEESVERDRVLKYTTKGIHKDDLNFLIGEYPVKKFGSQGQQKSFVIAIKLAQFEYMKDIKGFKPILLFDDIFDKLDDKRVEQIIKLVSEHSFGQVFITDTQLVRIKKLFDKVDIDHKIYEIAAGEAGLLNY